MGLGGSPISKKILIVDDDNDDTSLFLEALDVVGPLSKGYSAEDGKDALLKMKNLDFEPDIIFLDLNMPVMNGWDCLTQIKATEQLRNIPVIIHTTSSQKSDQQRALKMGALCFVTKSYDFKKIQMMLKIVIEQLSTDNLKDLCEAIHRALRAS